MNPFNLSLFRILIIAVLITVGIYFIPWDRVNWGKIQLLPGKTVTVVGQAKTKEKNQVATFTAGVTAVNDNKETAINEVNKKIDTIIQSVKDFGIKPEDIKTQNLSIYQGEETYYEEGVAKSRPGQWRVNNSIDVTLRDADRASALADLLSKSGATNVYGPSFSLENIQDIETSLLEDAIKNARKKAEIIAGSSGRKLGKIISVTEGTGAPTSFIPISLDRGGGGGASLEPGSGIVSKTATVIFELE